MVGVRLKAKSSRSPWRSGFLLMSGIIALSTLWFTSLDGFLLNDGLHALHKHVFLSQQQDVKDDRETTIQAQQQNELHNEQLENVPVPKLRYDWTNMTLTTDLAKKFEAHMTDCSLPLHKEHMMNTGGLGAELHVWGMSLCGQVTGRGKRPFSPSPWRWRDSNDCKRHNVSILRCYFPLAELRCTNDENKAATILERSGGFQRTPLGQLFGCPRSKPRPLWRAASTEYLFQSVSPLVIKEAERQLQLVFPGGKVPPDLITVHIRWGDKYIEMKLVKADEYVEGVKEILKQRGKPSSKVSIYLATEDPKAVEAFRDAAPKEWTIYVDQYFHDMLPYRATGKGENAINHYFKSVNETKGRAGLVALGSLLVAMEANDFVLTTASNWSRLMNELRKNVIDPRCGGCTHMVDLLYGDM